MLHHGSSKHDYQTVGNQSISKTIYFIRHAESEYNAYKKQLSVWLCCKCCFDPLIYDPKLSPFGQTQLISLKNVLNDNGILNSIQVVLVSPLTRTLLTCLSVFDNIKQSKGENVPIIVEPILTEILDTSADVGRTRRELEKDYPHLDFSKCVDENWWYYDKTKGPRIPVKEPTVDITDRIYKIKQLLANRPEQIIAVVSHSALIKKLTSSFTKIPPCGILSMQQDPITYHFFNKKKLT